MIDSILRPFATNVRNRRFLNRTKRPELTSLADIDRLLFVDNSASPRVSRTVFNPLREIGDNVFWQFAFRRHLQRFMFHRLQQQAVGGLLRHKSWPRIAAGQDTFTGIQNQSALDRFGVC